MADRDELHGETVVGPASADEVHENVDHRLMTHWVESGRRQQAARSRLANSSLPVDRFEGWALDLIVDALVRDEVARETRRSVQVLPAPRDG